MDKRELLGPWLRRFLLEHLVHERNLSHNTQQSYRDTLTMLLPFVAERAETALDRLQVIDVSANRVRAFLTHLEQVRKVSISTRNQRLAAIHALAQFIAEHSPQHVAWAGEVRTVPFKKTVRQLVCYLDKHEVEALLATPDRTTTHGQRNYALLLFLYNSGARASEAANLCIADLELDTRHPLTASVRILGKGGKVRRCPLWQKTALELEQITKNRSPEQRVFLNRRREPLTRFGIHTLIRTCVVRARRRFCRRWCAPIRALRSSAAPAIAGVCRGIPVGRIRSSGASPAGRGPSPLSRRTSAECGWPGERESCARNPPSIRPVWAGYP